MVPKSDGGNKFRPHHRGLRPYATAITGATAVSASEHIMQKADAETASSSVPPESEEEVKSSSEQAPLSEPAREGSDNLKMTDDTAKSEASTAAVKPGASGGLGKPKTKAKQKPTKTRSRFPSPTGKFKSQPSSTVRQKAMDVAVAASKRDLELDTSPRTPGASKDTPDCWLRELVYVCESMPNSGA